MVTDAKVANLWEESMAIDSAFTANRLAKADWIDPAVVVSLSEDRPFIMLTSAEAVETVSLSDDNIEAVLISVEDVAVLSCSEADATGLDDSNEDILSDSLSEEYTVAMLVSVEDTDVVSDPEEVVLIVADSLVVAVLPSFTEAKILAVLS